MVRPLLALALLSLCRPADAQDAFEIQVYDSEGATAKDIGVEVHANAVADGRRDATAEGELPSHHVGHVTLEPHIGLADWAELGGYLQTALRPDGYIDWAGWKVRLKLRLPRKLAGGRIGLALNGELSDVPRTYDPNQWGTELRPIADLRAGRLYAAINPIIGIDLAGPLAGHPQLQPAAKLGVRIVDTLYLSAEYYAVLGPIDALLPVAAEVHRLFGVLDWERRPFSMNVGAGYGFAAGDRVIVKAIFGVDLGH